MVDFFYHSAHLLTSTIVRVATGDPATTGGRFAEAGAVHVCLQIAFRRRPRGEEFPQ